MAKRRTGPRKRTLPAERRVDVTRLEYERLLDAVSRNADAVQRLEMSDAIQLKRTAELQAEINELRRALQTRVPKQST